MSHVRKAVIPAAGLGTRFLPATKAQPKEMIPVVDTPAIQYVVEEAVAAGLDDVLVVTGRSKRSLEDHFDRNVELELELEQKGKTEELAQVRAIAGLARVHAVRQGEPLGLGHAVGVARQHVGDDPFAVLLPDDLIIGIDLLAQMLDAFGAHGGSVIALKEVTHDEISLYGAADIEPVPGASPNVVRVRGLVEKPPADEAPSNLAVMGRYVFTPDIFGAIERVQPGKGGEIQLTDAIGLLLAEQPVYGYTFTEGRYDTGSKLDYLRAVVELAARRDDLGPAFREFLAEFVRREGIA
jgi:UTP--glucose-1-phosphate uridylyltransferase